jgi:uncharacterized membrane protein YebE (DUF533 family)
MNNNINKFEENKNVSVNEQQEVAQVENKKSVMGKIVGVLTNKYTLIGLGTVAVGYLGYKGYQIWKAKKAAAAQTQEGDFEDPDKK